MRMLLLPLAIAAALPYLLTTIAKAGAFSLEDNRRTRDWATGLDGWRKRAYWAQLNSFEGYPIFAASLIAALATVPTSAAAAALAWGYVGSRLAYAACYLADAASLRSLVWMAGLGCCAGLFGLAIVG
ncbi:MAG: MAPEG family protein [Kofleriaceae bacterium]